MIRISKRGLFVTGTENLIFLSSTHNYNDQQVSTSMYKKKYIYPFLEKRSLAHGSESPSSLCLHAPSSPLTPAPASHQQDIYLHTDDINMPASPVGHMYFEQEKEHCFLFDKS